eukprot:TRINITY_DN76_c0_g1_i2.p1 TRINITY_DN76_c0_g1~~TRINITY_DN76_c0_g1_i2.p1  ORF type:complete len:229 (-),score=24.11 TRINITY_DN76_c0_g1_i2:42-728(-)
MVKHNNMLVNNHFKKAWQIHVKTWFNQPAKRAKRRLNRQKKASYIFPRPVSGPLRPLVHGQTLRYQSKLKFGRGFSLDELKLAKISPRDARTIGISVDFRRRNRSLETQTANVQRLALYKSKLVLFPRKAKKPKKGDATKSERNAVVQQTKPFPYHIVRSKDKARVITEKEKTDSAFMTLRKARLEASRVGDKIRKERKAAAGASAAASKKEAEPKEEKADKGGKKKK